ncbi:hypothetical protein RDWZM_005175 [Blomia tropicalis]|uniref:Uncharacterized protein n=1 Tax=Blomia tropicalis TaxID=40697 RepID=A0A9Q0M3I3_BLOTA|nr:hypothetical protein RDWZM_005175 [Blomia tropicalis]
MVHLTLLRIILIVLMIRLINGISNDVNNIEKDTKIRDKCEIEIFTRGNCFINNHSIKPQVVLSFQHNPKRRKLVKYRKSTTPIPSSSSTTTTSNDIDFGRIHELSKDPDLRQRVIAEFAERFIELMKQDYGSNLNPLLIDEIQFVKLKHWGDASIYDLKVYGLESLEPIFTKLLSDDIEISSSWRFLTTLQVANLTSQFKVDANLNQKIIIRNWNLQLLMERCQLQLSFEMDFESQLLKINSIHLKSFDNFRLHSSEPLSWPFNEVVSSIVKEEKYYIRNVIELNAQKYINLTLSRGFDLNSIVDKILRYKSDVN